jgi:hypothetical protein
MVDRQSYENLSDALAVARDDSSAIEQLGQLGWGNVVVAEILSVNGAFEIHSVVARPETGWQPSHQQYVVRSFKFGSLTCPVCERVGVRLEEFRIGNATVQRVGDLDPARCRGCHDVLTHNGIAPTDFSTDPLSKIPRP